MGRVRATTDPTEFPTCDYGIVATKSMHTRVAIRATAHAFADAAVCSVQNGVGNEEIIAEHVRGVIRGVAFLSGRVLAPGHVVVDNCGEIMIAPFEPKPVSRGDVEALAGLCTRAGLRATALSDARSVQWQKLIFNAAANAIGALTGSVHGRIAEHEPSRLLAEAVMAEGIAVATAQEIVLDSDPAEHFYYAARRGVAYDHKSSMLQDIEAGRPTEIDFLNGAIVQFGERCGVDAPLNRALTALVKGLSDSRSG